MSDTKLKKDMLINEINPKVIDDDNAIDFISRSYEHSLNSNLSDFFKDMDINAEK